MTTATSVDIGTLIWKVPGILNGAPCVAGTRMPVRRIASLFNQGMTPDEIQEDFTHLELAQIYAALTYYFANKQEVDDDLESVRRSYEEGAAEEARRIAAKRPS